MIMQANWDSLLQLSSTMYKTLKGEDGAKEELDKHLVAFEKELKNVNQTFIGGEPFIFKLMIQIFPFCSQLFFHSLVPPRLTWWNLPSRGGIHSILPKKYKI